MELNFWSRDARKRIIDTSRRVGAVHFGGIFSIIDFFIVFYSYFSGINLDASNKKLHKLEPDMLPKLFMSKGHCYLAQLASLDTLFLDCNFSDNYLRVGTELFGHPKRDGSSKIFMVSSGSLGQGLAMANGAALANKLRAKNDYIWSVIGDGELNEGVVNEAIQFSAQNELRHIIVIDNNKQESLDFTGEIISNGNLEKRFSAYNVEYYSIDGHNLCLMLDILPKLASSKGTVILDLHTIKGFGVSFMARQPEWHSRRLKDFDYELACKELRFINA